MDLVQKRKQLRQRQVEKVKKFRQSNMSASAAVEKQKDREQMKKEIKQELSQESINIENSDGVTFARVFDIVGPSNMKPMISNGVWKGTEQISEMNDEEDEQSKEDPALKAKQKRADQIKKQVLLKKIQAVRQGSGENIMASYDANDNIDEGSLHKWFKGSKSKDGKGGWVNVVTGGTCASDEPGEGTPKCVSSSKRASMSKAERASASRRKKEADPVQQSKSGAAKPTYVATDKKKKSVDEACWAGYTAKGMKKKGKKVVPNCVKEGEVVTEADKKGKGSGKKDACYHKVKASAKVWPSAYASGRLVQCRKKGAGNYGKSKSESYSWRDDFDYVQEGAAWTKKAGKNKEGGLNEKGRKSYERENPGSDLKAPQPEGGSRKKSFCARMGGMKKKLTSSKTANDPDSRINKALRKWKC